MEFLSECCDAVQIGELDSENKLGFCGRCKDNASFYSEATIWCICGEVRTDDERLLAGLKCSYCTY